MFKIKSVILSKFLAILIQSKCHLITSPDALMFLVQDGTSQTSLKLESDLFEEYELEQLHLSIDVKELKEVLAILTPDHQGPIDSYVSTRTCTFTIKPERLELKEGTTTASMLLYDPPAIQALSIAFDLKPLDAKIILKADLLREGLQSIDDTATKVRIHFNPFVLEAVGINGETKITFPLESLDSIEASDVTHTYMIDQIKGYSKALAVSDRTYIKVNEDGILCLQCNCKAGSDNLILIETIILPLIISDSDEDS